MLYALQAHKCVCVCFFEHYVSLSLMYVFLDFHPISMAEPIFMFQFLAKCFRGGGFSISGEYDIINQPLDR